MSYFGVNLRSVTEPIQIHVEHLYKLYLLSIHNTEGVHPAPNSFSTSDSDSPPESPGLPISSSQRSVQVVRTNDSAVTARRIEYGLANVILICFSLVDRWSFEHAAEVVSERGLTEPRNILLHTPQWHKEIHQLCPHIPFILIGTKLDLRRPDPYVLQHDIHTRPLRLTLTASYSTTPQPHVRPHPFPRLTFRRSAIARSDSVATTSSHSFEEKRKKRVRASSEIDRHLEGSQFKPTLVPNREPPSTTKRTSLYGTKRKDSISPTSSPKLHHAPFATNDHPPNSPSLPSTSGSPTSPSLQATHVTPSKPSTARRPSLNILGLGGVGRSLSAVNPFKRTRAGSISSAAAMEFTTRSSVTRSDGPTGPPSPAVQSQRPGPSSFRPALLHRHTTDIVTRSTTSGRSGSGKSVAFSGIPLTLTQLATDEGVTASGIERSNQSQRVAPRPPMSPTASESLIRVPTTSPTPTTRPVPFAADPISPPFSPKGKAKVAPIKLPSASTPASGSRSPGSPEPAPGASPHQDGDGGRDRTPPPSNRNSPISYNEAHAMARQLGASAYIECSALTLVNVVAVFEEAVKVAGKCSTNHHYFG